MKLLLDTHIWIWSALEPRRLSRRVASALSSPRNELWLSSISVWETLMLARKGTIRLDPSPDAWVRRALRELPVLEAPLSHEVALQTESLDVAHRDPADLFILATALVHELTLVTADRQLLKSRTVSMLSN